MAERFDSHRFLRPLPPAEPRRLAVVTCYFNPCGYRSLRDNYLRFINDMRWFGLPLFVVEAAYDGAPFVDDTSFLRLRAGPQHVMWQKERLLNLIVERLPEEFDAVAWLDADALLLDSGWPRKAVAALGQYPAVQLFEKWHFTDAHGRIDRTKFGVGHLGQLMLKNGRGAAAPGGAWAAHRTVFPLYDAHVLGGGDSALLETWLAMEGSFVAGTMSAGYQRDYARWQRQARRKIRGRVTCLPGEVAHLYHGHLADRRYTERHQILSRHAFDPAKHLQVDEQGLNAWTNAAPADLRAEVRDYFLARREDDGISVERGSSWNPTKSC